MAKITEEVIIEKGTPKVKDLEQIKSLNLSRLGLKTKDLPVHLLSRCTNLEKLDLSGNMLQEMPVGLCLPSLRVLDCSNNDMEDITSLQSLTILEELNLENNIYLTINDQHKAIFLLPKLRIFSGKGIGPLANHIRHVTSGILKKRVVEIWEGSYGLPNPPTTESLAKVEKNFISDACFRVKYGPSSLSLYTKWRVEMIAKEHFHSLIQTKEKDNTQNIPTGIKDNGVCLQITLTPIKRMSTDVEADSQTGCTPKRARLSATTPTKASPRKSSRLQNTPQKADNPVTSPVRNAVRNLATPTKQQRTSLRESAKTTPQKRPTRTHSKTETNTPERTIKTQKTISAEPVCLQPLHVLQCHSKQDDPNDFETQIWACAFEPAADISDCGNWDSTVATCGGETVCFIDCETGNVLKKYKVPGEEFFSLAWSSLLMSVKGGVARSCSILAAAGKRGVVKLIHSRANLAFGEFRASRRATSILRFSPRQSSYLFTGGYDKKISLWDIGDIDQDYNFKVSQLLVLETSSTPLHLALPPSSADKHLITACDDGLLCFNIQLNTNTKKRTMQMEVTFPAYGKKDKTNNYRTIDGLCFLSDDVVASKSHMQGSIYLWSWSRTLASSSGKKKVSAEILAELQWSNTDIPYLSLNTCPSHGYLVCGDEKGRLWTYHVTDHMKANFKSGKTIPTTEVLEWPSPVRAGFGPVEGHSINSVAMNQNLRYLVALSDNNMVVVWKNVAS
ncbi:leucine-rich repeat and WD repeat-containing protein 1 isoform X2 [Clupea harengus]|nr:leucine-rich repeat and WD repeat-containing protein 1 isoform X2 [Clupea harengus]XP_031427375.1 leucine-rich repeat and WD repeat-containing protein 1 isoform X2 [Clupea harengus]XP_031427376.1 leucine-rich repeat and WD repeat-containing protein 1 isoform X2 [Clupea harengus]XP_031427377.1 leucine-rich repeat and WD repeat-containing protein 1 isoform X2 [Clupea harengus]